MKPLDEQVPVMLTWKQVGALRQALVWIEETGQLADARMVLRGIRRALPVEPVSRPSTKGDR